MHRLSKNKLLWQVTRIYFQIPNKFSMGLSGTSLLQLRKVKRGSTHTDLSLCIQRQKWPPQSQNFWKTWLQRPSLSSQKLLSDSSFKIGPSQIWAKTWKMTAHEENPPIKEVQRLTPTLNFNSIQILYNKFLFPDTSEIRLQETSFKPTVVEKLILQRLQDKGQGPCRW